MIPDKVQRIAWFVASAGVVALALAVSLDKPWVAPHPHPDAGAADASADAGASSPDSSADPTRAPAVDPDASLAALSAPTTVGSPMDILAVSDASTRSVRMGIVLVQFAGAQGAPPTARTRASALELSRKLADEAKTDFHQAVTHGDPGSADDIGRIARGILEPPVEGLVFSMSAGQTSEPVETPRGYWVVKRLE